MSDTQHDAAVERVVNAARKLVCAWDEFGTDCREAVGEALDRLIDAVDGLGDDDPATGTPPVPDEVGEVMGRTERASGEGEA